MKRLMKKTKGVVKGVPSAVLLSAVIHVALLLVAGGLIVFTAVERKEKIFVPPPPVERPKMDLIKPKVRIKNQPRSGAPTRITTKAQPQGLPEMNLPALEGMGEGLGDGVGGFTMMADLSEMSLFGGPQSAAMGNDLEGTFYQMEYYRDGRESGMDDGEFASLVREFLDLGWNPNVFLQYYRSPQKLFATQIFVPPCTFELGPANFGMRSDSEYRPLHWIVHYKGKFANKEGGRFRFSGYGDNILLVRVNGVHVLDASYKYARYNMSDWSPDSKEDRRRHLGAGVAGVGYWFDLEPGVPADIEVVIGEGLGGGLCRHAASRAGGRGLSPNPERVSDFAGLQNRRDS